jgi:multidrug efflux pump subunit AcrA (membrane-fusion protein)
MNKRLITRILIVILIITVGVVGMTFLGSDTKESNKRDVKEEIRTVEIQNIAFGEIKLEVEGHGVIQSQNALRIVSEVSGRIDFAKNNLKNGTYVKQGETVLQMDSREIENNLYSMRSDFLNTVASVLPDLKIEDAEVYEKWHNYFLSIDYRESIPELPSMTKSSEKIKISSRNILTKYYAVKNQEILLSKYNVIAPFSGYLKSSGIMENSFVSAGQELFFLEDVVNLEIAVPLMKEELAMVDMNGSIPVKIFPDDDSEEYLPGYIARTDKILEKNSQTLNAYVKAKNYSRNSYYLPGNYVRVLIDGYKLKDVASIPRHTLDDNSNIFVMEKGKLAKLKVEVAAFQSDQVIIKKTIPNNTKLVTTILQKALLGMPLQALGSEEDFESISTSDDDSIAQVN